MTGCPPADINDEISLSYTPSNPCHDASKHYSPWANNGFVANIPFKYCVCPEAGCDLRAGFLNDANALADGARCNLIGF